MKMKRTLVAILKVVLPLVLAGGILWWMYRGFDWQGLAETVRTDMRWSWMLLSFPFCVSAQVFRALRWRQALEPLGEHPRVSTCVNAVFISYASSLVVPRVGEVLRCGVLSRYEGTSFGRSIGAVVTERVVDMSVVLIFSLLTLAAQVPVFMRFFAATGFSVPQLLGTFSGAGYLVAGICVVVLLLAAVLMVRRLNVFTRTRSMMSDFGAGMLSVRRLRRPWLFGLYTVGIWLSYYLHFYLTFFCFDFTEHLGATAAMVAFVVGCFAVLVPTPNGAGPWHFAVKTALVLYGISATDAAAFVLVVHTIQTLMLVLLGLYALPALALTPVRNDNPDKCQ
jgi:uncharacterized protein (TIRG00374 family)